MMLRTKLITKFIFLGFLFVFANFAIAQDIAGVWLTAKGESKIQIYLAKNGLYQGKLIWSKIQNERTLKHWGSLILTNLKKISEKEYEGQAHNPSEGKTYNCIITIINKNELDLRGYIGLPILGKTQRWTRVE